MDDYSAASSAAAEQARWLGLFSSPAARAILVVRSTGAGVAAAAASLGRGAARLDCCVLQPLDGIAAAREALRGLAMAEKSSSSSSSGGGGGIGEISFFGKPVLDTTTISTSSTTGDAAMATGTTARNLMDKEMVEGLGLLEEAQFDVVVFGPHALEFVAREECEMFIRLSARAVRERCGFVAVCCPKSDADGLARIRSGLLPLLGPAQQEIEVLFEREMAALLERYALNGPGSFSRDLSVNLEVGDCLGPGKQQKIVRMIDASLRISLANVEKTKPGTLQQVIQGIAAAQKVKGIFPQTLSLIVGRVALLPGYALQNTGAREILNDSAKEEKSASQTSSSQKIEHEDNRSPDLLVEYKDLPSRECWWGESGFRNYGHELWKTERRDWLHQTVESLPPDPPPCSTEEVIEGLTKESRTFTLPGRMKLSDVISLYQDIWDAEEYDQA